MGVVYLGIRVEGNEFLREFINPESADLVQWANGICWCDMNYTELIKYLSVNLNLGLCYEEGARRNSGRATCAINLATFNIGLFPQY